MTKLNQAGLEAAISLIKRLAETDPDKVRAGDQQEYINLCIRVADAAHFLKQNVT